MRTTAVLACTLLLLASATAMANDDPMTLGKKIFAEQAQPSCTVCHALEDAGSAGTIGPNLDELKPTQQQVRQAVGAGVGIMPGFEDSLSAEEIDAVAFYVAKITGGATD